MGGVGKWVELGVQGRGGRGREVGRAWCAGAGWEGGVGKWVELGVEGGRHGSAIMYELSIKIAY